MLEGYLFFNTTIWQWLCLSPAILVVVIHFKYLEWDCFHFYHRCINQIKLFHFCYHWSISVSKASLVFTLLKSPIIVFSNTLTCSASLFLSLWTQPLKELAELHLWGLYVKISCRREECCSNISHYIIMSCKLYILVSSPKFFNFIVL